jgi:hypothetical protein
MPGLTTSRELVWPRRVSEDHVSEEIRKAAGELWPM